MKRKEKIERIRFPPKAVTVYSGEKEQFDCKNNYRYGKLANFWLDNISNLIVER